MKVDLRISIKSYQSSDFPLTFVARSEEHTSELQSQFQLVCRLLLEKKNVCQDVCPWNVKFARPTSDAELGVRHEIAEPDLAALLEREPESFARRFGDTPFERPGVQG